MANLNHLIDRTRRRLAPAGVTAAELLHRFVESRDETAFETLVQRYGPLVLGLCRRRLRNPADADDAFQTTFLLLARKAGSIRRSASLSCWLHGVAVRVANAAARRERPVPLAEEPAAPSADGLLWRDVRVAIDDELANLPETVRTPLVLCYLQGWTRDEAAAELNVPPATLHGRLERGRQMLARRLSARGVTLSAALATLATPTVVASDLTHRVTSAALAVGRGLFRFISGFAALITLAIGTVIFAALTVPADEPRAKPVVAKVAKSRLVLSASGTHDGKKLSDHILSIDPESGDCTLLAEGGFRARVSPDGRTLVFVTNTGVWNADTKGGNNPGKLFDDSQYGGYGGPVWSRDGKHLYVSRIKGEGGELWNHETTRYTASGESPEVVKLPAGEAVLDVSPDGKTFLTRSRILPQVNASVLYSMQTEGKKRVQLSQDGGFNEPARFSPDGRRVVYVRGNGRNDRGVWVVGSDGKDRTKVFDGSDTYIEGVCWSPDGKRIAVIAADFGENLRIPIGQKEGNWRVELVTTDGKEKTTVPLKLDGVTCLRGPDWFNPPKE